MIARTLAATAAVGALALAAALPAQAATSPCTGVGSAGGVFVRGISVTAAPALAPPCRDPRLIAVSARNRLAGGGDLAWSQRFPGGRWTCGGVRNDEARTARVDCRLDGRSAVRVAVRATLT
ncbi:MAG: hypothetical protein MUE51_05665 [Thermoleophilia bacterium]|nr:hypothetical protein [Thermoleophilia bacterium]